MQQLRRLVLLFKSRRKAHLALAFLVLSNQLGVVALAASPAPTLSVAKDPQAESRSTSACAVGGGAAAAAQQGCTLSAGDADRRVQVPAGLRQCPASGPGAACAANDLSAVATPGVASTPDGQSPCPASDLVAGNLAACTNATLSAPADLGSRGTALASVPVSPSVPVSSLQPALADEHLSLEASATFVHPGEKTILTATADTSVTSTGSAIEIFDLTTGTLAGACEQSAACSIGYTAVSGIHTFAAYLMPPGVDVPSDTSSIASRQINVTWLAVALSASDSVVGPGRPITFTATSTFDVGKVGRQIVIYDNTTGERLTYCSHGTTCSTSISEPRGGAHEILGWVPGRPEAVSQPLTATWLNASLTASTTYPQEGGTVHLVATSNVDLTNTRWSLGIYNQDGRLVSEACKSGNTCAADVIIGSAATPTYTAVIGATPPASADTPLSRLLTKVQGPPNLIDIQAQSAAVAPTHMLWGVDSCKAFTSTPNGADGLFPDVTRKLGTPNFWGRYLTTTVCPALSSAEIATAALYHIGILPIYNDYDCSAVVGYTTGKAYADAATAAAIGLGIPQGRGIAIDIEPPGAACPGAANVDGGFIGGWFDGVFAAGYIPIYYGNGTAGSEFATAWCAAVGAQPAVATYAYLWSFEPSLLGSFNKVDAPGFAPNVTGCLGATAGWQYQISAGSNPDVDHDEALSSLPIWFPST